MTCKYCSDQLSAINSNTNTSSSSRLSLINTLAPRQDSLQKKRLTHFAGTINDNNLKMEVLPQTVIDNKKNEADMTTKSNSNKK